MEDNSSDSESSGEEGSSCRAKNVNCLLVESRDNHQDFDENYAYKRKLGDLIFNANFEAGNLASVKQIDEFEFELMIRPDVFTPNSHCRCWFNFTISNQRPGQSIILTFVNITNELASLFHQNLTPVVRTRKQPNWSRLDADQVFYYKSSQHNELFLLSLAFKFVDCSNEHQFALFYPYSLSNLTNFINRWQVELKRQERTNLKHSLANCKNNFKTSSHSKTLDLKRANSVDFKFIVDILANSFAMRPIFKLSIVSLIKSDDSSSLKPKVILIRQTSGNFECQVSFVCQGYLDFMLSQDPIAQLARQQFDSLVLPMLDPDSICAGNSLLDLFGKPVNSEHLNGGSDNEPTGRLRQQESAHQLDQTLRVARRLLDHEIECSNVGCVYENSFRMEAHLRLARLLSRFSDGFYLEQCKWLNTTNGTSGQQPHDLANGLLDFSLRLPNVDQYKLEVSPFAYYKRSLLTKSFESYTQQKYLLLGKSLVYSLVELFRHKMANNQHWQANPKVIQVLDSFHLDSSDIDDVALELKRKF